MFVYSDGGVGASDICVSMTVNSVRKIMVQLQSPSSSSDRLGDHHVPVEITTAEEIISGKLSNECCLLIMPGGRDLPYVDKLRGEGNKNISDFVRNGGSYLGICAGAYYGCSLVQFAQGDPLLEVVGPRELSFFPGTSRGPVYKGFDYTTNEGAKAADIQLTPSGIELLKFYAENKAVKSTPQLQCSNNVDNYFKTTSLPSGGGEIDSFMKIYYNGGCHFVDNLHTDRDNEMLQEFTLLSKPPYSLPMRTSPYKVLATYATPTDAGCLSRFVSVQGATQPPLSAIVAGHYGKGRVVLSGVHFEASSELLRRHYKGDPYIESLQTHIADSDAARERLLSACVRHLLNCDE